MKQVHSKPFTSPGQLNIEVTGDQQRAPLQLGNKDIMRGNFLRLSSNFASMVARRKAKSDRGIDHQKQLINDHHHLMAAWFMLATLIALFRELTTHYASLEYGNKLPTEQMCGRAAIHDFTHHSIAFSNVFR